ncbi:DUF5134 domain-containing protein [Amycolatopsis regifaucium]|uniref:DUF5134 domain-containing protein n=1 Tax=Amycolatopsis regifaucium TaxID=546365 RepID=A0A154MJC8_9PSEU|nr:DUF5134 domain-containing protein [Amycolatopsis regifaucium]KZB84461.1 hypothetical protein AVL48_32220 [Amycolatopsis regifaucium]OKA10924.1 DUF5134 domain-containing protein [Amycolatopsis regifaucium]SFI22220.1 hypothetical protein SAMN04489731_109121 [Amycolatopsis regifaucium]
MSGVVAWILTAVFAALVLPCVLRLVRLDYRRLGGTVRDGDLAELLLIVAMVAMLCPVGGPIPAAGWQAVLALTAGWFAVSWWKGRRSGHAACGHHAVSAAAMLIMVTFMPHSEVSHGPWLVMSGPDATPALWLSLVFGGVAAYFAVDAVRAGILAARSDRGSGQLSRRVCRVIMGFGMGYMLIGAAV